MRQHRFIPLAVITTPHGILGAFKIKPFTDNADLLHQAGPWQDKAGAPYPLRIVGEAKGQWICQLPNVTDRSAAAALRGTELGLWREQLPDPAPDEYYVTDLVGMQVLTADGALFGDVLAVRHYGASELLEVRQAADGKTELFPFTHAVFPEIRHNEKTITINPPGVI